MKPKMDGPIPGENYTSDVRNYPWHRPPDITDYDQAVEYVVDQISKPQAITTIMSLLEAGFNLTSIVSMLNMVNISNGKYPIDVSILIAGPVARYLQILGKKNDIDVKVGDEGERKFITLEHLKGLAGITEDDGTPETTKEALTAPVSNDQVPSGGLMGVSPGTPSESAPASVQSAMLGYSDDEEEEV